MFRVGIDLGTTHSALAFVPADAAAEAPLQDFPVLQAVRPGEVEGRALLPPSISLPGPELPAAAGALPWNQAPGRVVGELARWQGARIPSRLVASAKSWLCHSGVDRQAAILPWGAPGEVLKVSP